MNVVQKAYIVYKCVYCTALPSLEFFNPRAPTLQVGNICCKTFVQLLLLNRIILAISFLDLCFFHLFLYTMRLLT